MRTSSKSSLIAILLLLLTSTAICQQLDLFQKEKTNTTWYIFADIPTIFYSSDQSFLETSFLQGYGGGVECLFNGRTAIGLDIYRDNVYINFHQLQLFEAYKGWKFTPTFKLYLDSYKKLSLNIGTQFLFHQETIKDEDGENSQKYWQNAIRLGAGYKMYLFKKKNFGTEVFIGTNLLLWGNSEPWTNALKNRGMIIEGTIFYKLAKNRRK